MFTAALKGYSAFNNDTSYYTVQWLREKVVEKIEKDKNLKQLLITQIINIIQTREFTGLGDDFSEYLNSISYRDDEEFIAFVSNTVLQKYLENMKRDNVWGGEVELGVIAQVLQTCIYVVTPTYTTEINKGVQNRIILYLNNNHYDVLSKRTSNE